MIRKAAATDGTRPGLSQTTESRRRGLYTPYVLNRTPFGGGTGSGPGRHTHDLWVVSTLEALHVSVLMAQRMQSDERLAGRTDQMFSQKFMT